ncbi:MAG: hypothetical protein CL846_10790 [Crocinitomicaceae bacterium]|nr:hypothetical protein [Crocinitomicaceae bacterium]|tara:strand:- start:1129 stop:1917 length:789 start_codon:yes stop_codon:yes gene_type:complete
MKKILFIFFFPILLFFINSCSTSNDVVSNSRVQQRKYTSGFYVKNSNKWLLKNEIFLKENKEKTSNSLSANSSLSKNDFNEKRVQIADLEANVSNLKEIYFHKKAKSIVNNHIKSNIVNVDSTLINKPSSGKVFSLFREKSLLNKLYLILNKKFNYLEEDEPEPKFHWSLKAAFLFFSLALIISWFALFDGGSVFVTLVGPLSIILYTFFSYIARKEINNNSNYKGKRLANILYHIGIASIYILVFTFFILLILLFLVLLLL